MLVLERKINERILIGEDIKVMVTGLKNGKVRLGIEAPPGTPVLREELKTGERVDKVPEEGNSWRKAHQRHCGGELVQVIQPQSAGAGDPADDSGRRESDAS